MSRIPTFTRKVDTRTSASGASTCKAPCADVAKVRPRAPQESQPSLLQKRVFTEALAKSAQRPKAKVSATGAQVSQIRPPIVKTKRGPERVIQQTTVETTTQSTPKAQYKAATTKAIDVDPSGSARQVEVTAHQIDPAYPSESAGINQTISTTSTVSVTSSGRQVKKSIKKQIVKDPKRVLKPTLNPVHLHRLIREENEDIENTLKMAPPELVSTSIDKYPLKRKLQNLRINSESMAVLQQAVVYPPPTADELETETSPEVMAGVIEAVEKGATPNSAPTKIFNSLFPDVKEAHIDVSSVAPGPLQDIVVPISLPPKITDEVLNEEMERSAVEVQNTHVLPLTDFCVENNITAPAPTSKAQNKKPALLEIEIPPWEEADMGTLTTLLGGDSIENWEPTDVSTMDTTEDLVKELSKGIDYFIDANINPCETKVQLRGSKLPNWFPGYMTAFPHVPELVRIAKKPSGVLHSAWKAVQPKIFPDESLLIAQ